MSALVNLLLLLSALFSALSGAGTGVRQAPVTVAQQVRAACVAAVRAVASCRPVAALPTRFALAVVPVARSWRLMVAEPLYASRRRE